MVLFSSSIHWFQVNVPPSFWSILLFAAVLPDSTNYWNKTTCIYLFKVSNENTRLMCEIWSKLIMKTLEQLEYFNSCLWTNFTRCFGVFIAQFEQVNVGWERAILECHGSAPIWLLLHLNKFFMVQEYKIVNGKQT